MKSRADQIADAFDAYTPFEGMMEGLEEAKGYIRRTQSGMSHEQAVKEARAESEERILARAARQATENKPLPREAIK